jgi:serine carboxypeptidase 1
MGNLTWSGMPSFNAAAKTAVADPDPASPTGTVGAFVRKYEQLTLWWILDAGHMVPADQGYMALEFFKRTIGTA